MRISATLERPINWRDKQRTFSGYSGVELLLLIKDILSSNGLKINYLNREALILDTRIINRSKVNIKIQEQKNNCVCKVNILNAYSPSVYERFWQVVEGYLG